MSRRGAERLDAGVWVVGATSLLSDAGHEIATSLLPGFVTGVLHGSAAALGVIEGVSDALTGLAKVVGGPLADDPTRRRRIAAGGYLATAIATDSSWAPNPAPTWKPPPWRLIRTRSRLPGATPAAGTIRSTRTPAMVSDRIVAGNRSSARLRRGA